MPLPKWFWPNGISTYIRVPFNKCAYVIKFRGFFPRLHSTIYEDGWRRRVCKIFLLPRLLLFSSIAVRYAMQEVIVILKASSLPIFSYSHRARLRRQSSRQSNWNDFIKFCRFLPCHPLRLNTLNILLTRQRGGKYCAQPIRSHIFLSIAFNHYPVYGFIIFLHWSPKHIFLLPT